MWQEFFRFDLKYQLRQPLLWVIAVPLMLIAFFSAGSDQARIGGAIGNILLNAPVVIANQLSILSIVSMFLVTVFIAGTVLRDHEVGMSDLLFATPMRKGDYLAGRFLAGFLMCLVIFACVTLAMVAGALRPGIDPARLGPHTLQPYLWSFFVFVLPNLLFVSALLMLFAATTRSMVLVYVGALLFMALWSMAGFMSNQPGLETLAVLLDPFGMRALSRATRYYTSAQSNTMLPPLEGLLLLNRMVWSAIALGLFGLTVFLFKPQRAGTGRGPLAGRRATKARAAAPAPTITSVRRVQPQLGHAVPLLQWWQELRFHTRGVLRSVPFLVMLLLGVVNFVVNYLVGASFMDSTPYPLTRLMLSELEGGINAVLVIVLVFYSGDLIFRERQAKIADLRDALPVSNVISLLAKAGALIAVVASFLLAGAAAAIAIQLIVGGAPVELPLYLKGSAINATYFVLMGLAMLALQVLANNRFLGYGLSIALLGISAGMNAIGVEHRLAIFAALPGLQYSDLNGYNHMLTGWLWFALYWFLLTAALLALANAFWPRGTAAGWRVRLQQAGRALAGPTGGVMLLALAAWGACGAWIYHNTNVLNTYQSSDDEQSASADYERLYRRYLDVPHNRLTAVTAKVDIFPQQRAVNIGGRYTLQNKGTTAVELLQLQRDTKTDTQFLNLPPHQVLVDDRRFGFQVLKLQQPLAPGASMQLDFTVAVRNPGFTNSGEPGTIHTNGTLFAFENFFPQIGYNQSLELQDRNARRQHGLGEPHGMPKLDDPKAKYDNFWKTYGFDGDLIDLDTTVSTSDDQVAIAPGRLLQSWKKDGRHFYHYKMDSKVLPFFSFQSGSWAVKQGQWRDVPISVHYDPKHPYNIDSMIEGAKEELSFMSENFGPYQHKQLRILEIPLYVNYARSFPGTIPFSEALGFINDLRDPDGVDHVFYVAAHEVAHQWWGDQAIAANVQGSAMITETLAEYSALMAVERRFGAEKVRHILRFDLDQYLSGRGRELVQEQPLYKVENQVYIQYRKGSLIMYRLREEIGEQALNRALKNFISAHRYQSSPYALSTDLLRFIRAEAPADKQELITDMFERIVVYDNRMQEASATRRADGQWDVTLKVSLSKLEADGKGKEKERAYDEPVDIAIFARAPGAAQHAQRVLLRQQVRLPAGESTLHFTVKEKPFEAGVDPYNLLIDRKASDNRKQLTF